MAADKTNFKAVIFDMDGVIVDTENFYYDRRQAFFDGEGIDISEIPVATFIGGSMRELWSEILHDNLSVAAIAALQQRYENYKATHPLPYEKLLFPDAIALLDFLNERQIKIALASSSQMSDILRALSVNQLTEKFDVILSGEDFEHTKPDPAIYLSALAKLGVAASEALVIEDSPKGIAAGKAAGATVWAVKPEKLDLDQSSADRIFDSLSEIQFVLSAEKVSPEISS